MGLKPFQGGRQILEIDLGEGEASRVCGISGNPLRLGWNIEGNVWQNCFSRAVPPAALASVVRHVSRNRSQFHLARLTLLESDSGR